MLQLLSQLPKEQLKDKRVLLRLDLDVPLEDTSEVADATRLEDGMPTLTYLLEKGVSQVIIIGHLGRPSGNDKKFSLEPVARWFAKKLEVSSEQLVVKYELKNNFGGFEISPKVFLLENIRFFEEEEKNDPAFCKKLSMMGDIYINDAFAVSHRDHASITGIAKLLPPYAGLHLEKEVEVLTKVLEKPERPLVVIIGGAKIETKLPLVEKMHQLADYVLVGGKIADETKTLLQVQHEKVEGKKSALLIADLNSDKTDITGKSAENFVQIIQLAKTVVWNGPMGKIESSKYQVESSMNSSDSGTGTKMIAEGIIASGAYSVIGGGDSIGYLSQIGLLDKFSFVSSGGGAMLQFLSGEKIPGIEVLKK